MRFRYSGSVGTVMRPTGLMSVRADRDRTPSRTIDNVRNNGERQLRGAETEPGA